ncbi:hypothetical protein G4B88_009689 [Cannabis sativa]|uniref:Cytochrome c assembly protein domain-containing protein n=1 Tax=Cannabis sativa TaxID=3483 RepID=A0A7J6GDE2_CANSA|nr:hypothetical protein G4B88_009689 [Cannabis sativa]
MIGYSTVEIEIIQEPILIWILTCRWFLTVGILPGSWWAHHELGRGGWWFRDPVENASFMPRVLATAHENGRSIVDADADSRAE